VLFKCVSSVALKRILPVNRNTPFESEEGETNQVSGLHSAVLEKVETEYRRKHIKYYYRNFKLLF
jgi:hypothetical protein